MAAGGVRVMMLMGDEGIIGSISVDTAHRDRCYSCGGGAGVEVPA